MSSPTDPFAENPSGLFESTQTESKAFQILLVDDSEVNQALWSNLLEHEGFRVISARSGEEALERLDRGRLDLVLLDVMMPGMSGFEVLQAIRRRFSEDQLPVIMATAKDQSEDIVKAFRMGANDYVTKPLDFGITLARIQAQLRSRTPGTGRAISSDAVLPGMVLEGKYRIESMIGRGNFGAVFRATHLKLQRPVAVKLLRSSIGTDRVSQARFQQEGISLSRLQHPNAVHVLDFSVDENGLAYLVMELLDGQTLDQELRANGQLGARRCGAIAEAVGAVLTEAHRLGIIHRDIKPQNIFLHKGRQGEIVKVLDFGIAKLIGELEIGQQLTVEGSSIGTPVYMAPERFMNEPYDGRSDVYSLASMVYEMFCGRPPFHGADGNFFRLIRMHVTEAPAPLRSLLADFPLAVDLVVLAGLAKKPDERPSAEEFTARLVEAIEDSFDDETDPPVVPTALDGAPGPTTPPTLEWQNE
jgi:DNA-binding response OmpR family regulator